MKKILSIYLIIFLFLIIVNSQDLVDYSKPLGVRGPVVGKGGTITAPRTLVLNGKDVLVSFNGNVFENIKTLVDNSNPAKFVLSPSGDITLAAYDVNKASIYDLQGTKFFAPKDSNVDYKEGNSIIVKAEKGAIIQISPNFASSDSPTVTYSKEDINYLGTIITGIFSISSDGKVFCNSK